MPRRWRRCARAATLEPGRARIHTDIADVLAAMGRNQDAVGEYGLALRADANDFDAHLGLAELLILQGRTAEAIPHLRAAATSRDPGAARGGHGPSIRVAAGLNQSICLDDVQILLDNNLTDTRLSTAVTDPGVDSTWDRPIQEGAC